MVTLICQLWFPLFPVLGPAVGWGGGCLGGGSISSPHITDMSLSLGFQKAIAILESISIAGDFSSHRSAIRGTLSSQVGCSRAQWLIDAVAWVHMTMISLVRNTWILPRRAVRALPLLKKACVQVEFGVNRMDPEDVWRQLTKHIQASSLPLATVNACYQWLR